MNCANDNPLIDGDEGRSYHGGNFLGQYVGVAMDQLRYFLGLLVKHLDVQIALLMAPEFNQGLPPSLVGNQARKVNMGLKGLQISGNSIMPVVGVPRRLAGRPLPDPRRAVQPERQQPRARLGDSGAPEHRRRAASTWASR